METTVNYVLVDTEPHTIWYTLASLYPMPRQGDVFVYKSVSYDVKSVIISIDDKSVYVVLKTKKDYNYNIVGGMHDYLRG